MYSVNHLPNFLRHSHGSGQMFVILQHNMISSEKIQENPPRNVGQEDAVSVSAAGLLESK